MHTLLCDRNRSGSLAYDSAAVSPGCLARIEHDVVDECVSGLHSDLAPARFLDLHILGWDPLCGELELEFEGRVLRT